MDRLVIEESFERRLQEYFKVAHERLAFLLADHESGLVTDELYLTDGEDYRSQGRYHMELADHVRPRVLQWATGRTEALVEVHAHVGLQPPTTFSPTDLDGLEEIVPQILWRLQGRAYVAVVRGASDLDALVWKQRGEPPISLDSVVICDRPESPTGVAAHVWGGGSHRG